MDKYQRLALDKCNNGILLLKRSLSHKPWDMLVICVMCAICKSRKKWDELNFRVFAFQSMTKHPFDLRQIHSVVPHLQRNTCEKNTKSIDLSLHFWIHATLPCCYYFWHFISIQYCCCCCRYCCGGKLYAFYTRYREQERQRDHPIRSNQTIGNRAERIESTKLQIRSRNCMCYANDIFKCRI